MIPSWSHCCVEFARLPTSAWLFSTYSSFLPHPKDVHARGELVHLYCPSLSGCGCGVWVWVWVALQWKKILSRVGLTLYPELPGETSAIHNPEINKPFEK